jgi:hypothetical protein
LVIKAAQPPTGRTIVLELVKEMEDRLYPLFYRILPASVYHVYLHAEDYREIEAVTPLIVLDAQRGLNARVDELNRGSRWSTLISGKQPPIEVPPGGWEIYVHADANGELGRGELGIVSRLSVPPPPRFEGGTPTTRIVRTVVTGTIRRSTTSEDSASSPDSAPAQTTRGLARLSYVDDQGPHVFIMRKDLISIGRGGSAHWVDVQIVTGARVSREHCRIRRAGDGRFFLQDVSTWGTSIDGKRVPPFVRPTPTGALQETGDERELAPKSRIQLADAVLIEFHVEGAS